MLRRQKFAAKSAPVAETHLHPATALRLSRALAGIADAFDEWVVEAVTALARARAIFYDDHPDRMRQAAFRDAAHQVVWEADSLGQPVVAEIAQSLERLIAGMPADRIPRDIVDAHIGALELAVSGRAHAREHLADAAADLARATDTCLAAPARWSGH